MEIIHSLMTDALTLPEGFINCFLQLKREVLSKTQEALTKRGTAERDEAKDNQIFSVFNNTLQIFIKSNHLFGSPVIDIYNDLEAMVKSFEQRLNTEIHKGSIFFNAGLCYLWAGDFDKTLYYWTQADEENRLTRKNMSSNIFFETSYTQNLGQSNRLMLEGEIEKERVMYLKISGSSFQYEEYEQYMRSLDLHDLKNLIINFTRRVHYDRLEKNETTDLIYYRLLSDYCITFETCLKGYLKGKGQLTKTTLGKIIKSDIPLSIRNKIPLMSCNSVVEYNLIFPTLITDIDSETDRDALLAKIFYLINITRNQVVHDVETEVILYGNIQMCQRMIRIIIIALLFDMYL